MKTKWLAIDIILLFISVAIAPSINTKMPIARAETNATCTLTIPRNPGTLSGYVTDTAMNPIIDARVRVYFHNTSRENYSDATGYYHVTDIPICNCTKNSTCSKEGYNTAWVYLTIWENTTYDFVLIAKGHWLYVGGSGPGNYSRIQDAINASSDGDTVFVYDDSSPYNEFVWINKSVNLIGENKNTTVIDGEGTGYEVVVYITADNVSVTGFTICNCSELMEKGVLIIKASNVVIRENIIANNWWGIFEGPSSNNYILDNIIINTTLGIDSAFASTTINGNTIINHTFGINMQDTSNIVENNFIYTPQTVVKSTYGIDNEIVYFPSYRSIIKGNTIINHLVGISCVNTLNHIIFGNILTDNYIGIELLNSSNNEIKGNNITNSYWYGLYLENKANNNMVMRNTIENSSEYGIYLQYSFHNKFIENNIMKSNRSVYLENSVLNRWMKNYWERPRLLFYPIFGKMKLTEDMVVPWVNFDWRPARKPYDISGMR